MNLRGKTIALILLALATLAVAPDSLACPVCFGDSEAPIVKGLEASALFLIGVTYFLLSGGVVAFFLLRRRARRLMAAQQAPAALGAES